MYSDATNTISFSTNGNNRLTLASTGTAIFSGSVGIGNTTPSSWSSPFVAIQGGTYGQHIGFQTNGPDIKIGTNNYYNSGYIYTVSSNGAAQLNIGGNSGFQFNVAPSGTAGNAVNFTQSMAITSGGKLQVGSSLNIGGTVQVFNDATTGISIMDSSSSNNMMIFYNSSVVSVGSIRLSGASTQYNTTSDYRLKEDFKEIKGLEKVSAIKVYDFKWKSDGSRMNGVIAHELQEILPYAVSGIKDGEEFQQVDYSKLTPLLVKAIQELKAENDTLKAILQRNNIQ